MSGTAWSVAYGCKQTYGQNWRAHWTKFRSFIISSSKSWRSSSEILPSREGMRYFASSKESGQREPFEAEVGHVSVK